jgi:hypothetical protein
MKLEPTRPKKNRRVEAALGCLTSLLALTIFWVGLNSFLIGRAFFSEKAAWAPRTLGAIGVLIGAILLWRGVSRFVKNASKRRHGFEDDF